MESLGPWKLVKIGFWLGIGFVLPTMLVTVLAIPLTFAVPFTLLGMDGDEHSFDQSIDDLTGNLDRSASVEVVEYREETKGSQLLVLGRIRNLGEDALSSVMIEVELLDERGSMVYECEEYVQRLAGAATENFQVRCGAACDGSSLPPHSSLSVRVMGASAL